MNEQCYQFTELVQLPFQPPQDHVEALIFHAA